MTAGVPTRMPDDVFGGCWSNGIAFLLTVIPISSRRCSASLPVTPSGVTSTSIRWLSVPPETTRAPRSGERLRRASAAFSTVRRWSRRNSSLSGQLEGDGLGGDDVHQRPALDAREDASCRSPRRGVPLTAGKSAAVDPGGQLQPAEDQPAARPAQGLVGRRRDDVGVGERARVEAAPRRGRRCGPCRRTAAPRPRGRWPPSARSR